MWDVGRGKENGFYGFPNPIHSKYQIPDTRYQIPDTRYRHRAFFLCPIGRNPSSVKALHLPNMILSGPFPLPFTLYPYPYPRFPFFLHSVSNGLFSSGLLRHICHNEIFPTEYKASTKGAWKAPHHGYEYLKQSFYYLPRYQYLSEPVQLHPCWLLYTLLSFWHILLAASSYAHRTQSCFTLHSRSSTSSSS